MKPEQNGLNSGSIAVISDIQRYCVHDGPGLRTVVFFKGCPLRCKWCHNPETFKMMPEMIYEQDVCIGCGRCVEVCRSEAIYLRDGKLVNDRLKCTDCGDCVKVCPSEARKLIGKYYSVDDLMEIVSRDIVFYKNSGGGVTLSGGEVMLQSVFAEQLITSLKKDSIHTAIETCGYASAENFNRVAATADLILFDLKHPDSEKHKHYTGVDNSIIHNNLRNALSSGKRVIARYPLIPNVNDSVKDIEATGSFCRLIGIKDIHVLPFEQAGESKWKGLDKEYIFEGRQGLDITEAREASVVFKKYGLNVNIGGSGN